MVKKETNMKKVKKALGTHEIARVCHVTPPSVIRWMEEGKLVFFTTGGGHRRVWDADLAAFMSAHNMPVPAELVPKEGLRVLIVDDEEDMRRLIARAVSASYPQAELAEARDGFEAGARLYSFSPTLIILDLQLPMLDGFRVCSMIREEEALKGVKILAVTGHNTEESRQSIMEAGADDFLGKPFTINALDAALLRLLPDEGKA